MFTDLQKLYAAGLSKSEIAAAIAYAQSERVVRIQVFLDVEDREVDNPVSVIRAKVYTAEGMTEQIAAHVERMAGFSGYVVDDMLCWTWEFVDLS